MDWPENDFRIFVGDMGAEVTDEVLCKAFSHFPTFQRGKMVRDKRTNKNRGAPPPCHPPPPPSVSAGCRSAGAAGRCTVYLLRAEPPQHAARRARKLIAGLRSAPCVFPCCVRRPCRGNAERRGWVTCIRAALQGTAS